MKVELLKLITMKLKKVNFILILSLISRLGVSQNEDGKKVELQFKERVSFYAVDNRYNLLKDTVYFADDGFRVFSGFDIEKLADGKEYVILRYPNWKGRSQVKEKHIPKQRQVLLDSLFLLSVEDLYREETKQAEIYRTILDSLKLLSDAERLKKPYRTDIVGRDSLTLAFPLKDFKVLKSEKKIQDVYSLKWSHSTKIASGFMTIPFKLRPKQDSVNFTMTTDITLGAYLGVKKRISRRSNYFVVLPATLGLSYINVANNETSNVNTEGSSGIVPGWTWSSGLVFDFDGFNVGVVFGQDFASGVGEDWLYNGNLWYSFSIGYSFFNKDK